MPDLYRPQRSCEGYVFTPVCPQGGLSQCMLGYHPPPRQTDRPPRAGTLLGAGTLLTREQALEIPVDLGEAWLPHRQWRIQDFPEEASTQWGAQIYYLDFFPKKNAKNCIPNVKIVKNPSLIMLHWPFTMYWLRVHISQWWSLCIKGDGCTSWSIHSIVNY